MFVCAIAITVASVFFTPLVEFRYEQVTLHFYLLPLRDVSNEAHKETAIPKGHLTYCEINRENGSVLSLTYNLTPNADDLSLPSGPIVAQELSCSLWYGSGISVLTFSPINSSGL